MAKLIQYRVVNKGETLNAELFDKQNKLLGKIIIDSETLLKNVLQNKEIGKSYFRLQSGTCDVDIYEKVGLSYEIIQELLDDTGYFEMSAKEYFEKTTLYRTPEQLQNRNKVPYGIIREYLNELRDENSSEKIPSILDPELNDRLLELEKFVMEEDFDEFDVEDRMTMLFGKYGVNVVSECVKMYPELYRLLIKKGIISDGE